MLDIVTYPAEVLRRPAAEVVEIGGDLKRRVEAMFETMYGAPGVGLAAPQVGVSERYFVMDPRPNEKPEPLALINPTIVEKSGEIVWEEGCLSIPGFTAEIERANLVEVKALDLEGRLQRYEFSGFPAVIVQHEIDHLDGILFVDRLSRTRQRIFERDFGVDKFKWKFRPHR